MQGYFNDPKETARVLREGWLYTRDTAYRDQDGYIYIVGRKNDIIKYLGHRISPTEIENHINVCENILESAVVEHRNDEGDVSIVAYVVLKDKTKELADISKNLKSKLPSYKIPSKFNVINKLPRTNNQKIKRSLLKENENL